MSSAAKSFDILAIKLDVPHNYFDSLTKLTKFSDPAKILDLLA